MLHALARLKFAAQHAGSRRGHRPFVGLLQVADWEEEEESDEENEKEREEEEKNDF